MEQQGESFEFAHFTPLQLATAKGIVALPGHRRKPDLANVRQQVVKARDEHHNLRSLVPGGSKTRLAEELWPVPERRIVRGIGNHTEKRIPIVRVIDEAIAFAYEFPRRALVIRLDDDGDSAASNSGSRAAPS